MDDIFTSILNVQAEDSACPAGLNGAGGAVDMSNVSTYVQDRNMMVIDANGQFNVRFSIANSINVVMNNPTGTTAVTADNIKAALPSIRTQLYRYTLLDLIAHSGGDEAIVLTYRKADTKLEGEFALAPNSAACLSVADQIWSLVGSNARSMAKILPDPAHAVVSLCAQYLHRSANEGHAWYTEHKKGSTTHKILAVAGAQVELFAEFQEVYGHDLWHVLSNDTVTSIAMAVVGENRLLVNDGYVINGVVVEEGTTVEDVVKVPDATKDRLPAGIVGLSAMLLFSPLLSAVLDIIGYRVSLTNLANVRGLASQLQARMSEADFNRPRLLELRDSLAVMVAVCVGIGSTSASVSDFIEAHQSLVSFANRNELYVMRGKTIGNALKTIDIDNDEVIRALGSLLTDATRDIQRAIEISERVAVEDNEQGDN